MAWARAETSRQAYTAEIGVLYNLLKYQLLGTIQERIDRQPPGYHVALEGQGSGVANRIESSGTLRGGRWAPVTASSYFQVRGRESRSRVDYDHERRQIRYHFRGETFFRRRLRVVDDVLTVPAPIHVDDVISAMLNYADRRWPTEVDGSFATYVVRRRRKEDEGPDDIESGYRAELVPFTLRPALDPSTGRATALFDLTRFSSWARADQPGRIVFGPDRRPEVITTSLILGTTVTITLSAA